MERNRSALLVSIMVIASAAALPSEASARPNVLREGAGMGVTLGSSVDLLGLRHFPDRGFTLNAGPVSSDLFALFTAYNLPRFAAGLVLSPNLVVGANIEFAFLHSNPDGAFATDVNIGMIGLVPFFEYWMDGESLAPFFGAHFGPSITIADGIESQVWLTAGARGGLHFFAGDSFSVGPVAELNFIYTSHDSRAGYEIVLGLSFRGWVGGGSGGGDESYGPEPAPAPAPAGEPAYDPAPPPPADNPEQGLGNPEDGAY